VQKEPDGRQAVWAFPLFTSPKQVRAIPARPTPNFFNAARRLTDWAICFVSSSNLLFILFLAFSGALAPEVLVNCFYRSVRRSGSNWARKLKSRFSQRLYLGDLQTTEVREQEAGNQWQAIP
jgi:hypothetical protein